MISSTRDQVARNGRMRVPTELVTLLALLLPSCLWSQWTGGPTGPVYYSGGNVGIGTGNPGRNLSIAGSGATGIQLFSTTAPPNTGAWALIAAAAGGFILQNDQNSSQLFSISPGSGFYFGGGNVGIGTANPQYLLSVNGTIGTKDVIVTNTGWSDYVFRPGYRLRPLSEVRAYIEAHHNLPDIPSEAEVKEKGVSVGELQAKLLAKIEELTLHMIQAEQENRELLERVARLEASR